jgi:HD-like signal output (HDOD) protein
LLQDLWRHAVATAIASKHLTEMTSGEPEEAFVAGLLHDCGKLLVIKGLEDVTKGNPEPEITPALCGEIMDVLHADLGYRTLVRWHLPQAVCVAAQKHHETDAKDAGPLLLRVQAANAVARKLGHHLKPDPELDLLTLPAVERLSLSDIELASLMVDVDDEVAEVTRLV